MKTMRPLLAAVLFVSLCTAAVNARAADTTNTAKLKPYTLKTCVVSDDKLGNCRDCEHVVHELLGAFILDCLVEVHHA